MQRDVSKFALAAAALVFAMFLLFLFGTASAAGPLHWLLFGLPIGVWLVLGVHVLPVVLGIIHMQRASAVAEGRSDDERPGSTS